MDTALYMFAGGRYLYAVFMCHLAIEKALKGLYCHKLKEVPPKTHSLIHLIDKMGIKPLPKPGTFIAKLSEASIPTRYPEDLDRIQSLYTKAIVKDLLAQGKEFMTWVKKQL